MRTILVHPLTVNLHTNKLAVTNTYSCSSTVHIHDILLSHHHLLLFTDEFNTSLVTFCFINRVLADTTTNHVFSRHEFLSTDQIDTTLSSPFPSSNTSSTPSLFKSTPYLFLFTYTTETLMI